MLAAAKTIPTPDARESPVGTPNPPPASRRLNHVIFSSRILLYTPEAKRILKDRPDIIEFYFKHVFEPAHRSQVDDEMEAEGIRVRRIRDDYSYTSKAIHRLTFGDHDLFVKENWPGIDSERTGPTEFLALLALRRMIKEKRCEDCITTVEPVLAFSGHGCNFLVSKYDARLGKDGWRLRGAFDRRGGEDDWNSQKHLEFCQWAWNRGIGDLMEKNHAYDYNQHMTIVYDPLDTRRGMDKLEQIIELSEERNGVHVATSFQLQKTMDSFKILVLAEGRRE